jgi:citrate lyase subunit beta/citryl-CoA lyase
MTDLATTVLTDDTQLIAAATTALFVPGNRPERFAKALASGADVVIIDLEDAVAPDAKADALQAVRSALIPGTGTATRALVRINAAGTATHDAEVRSLLNIAEEPNNGLRGVVLPKAEDPAVVARLTTQLGAAARRPLALVLLVESAVGVANSLELARVPGVTRLALGAIDLALDLDAEADSPVLDYARAQVVIASRAAGIAAPLDSPSIQIGDLQAVEQSARTGRGFGFGGKLCIHPAQLTPVRAAFTPSEQQITWATSVVSAGDAAVQVDGQMIDKPVIEKARRILQRAGKVSA